MRYRSTLLRTLVLVGLAASAALAADHLTGAGAFCAFDGGCGAVAASAYGAVAGVPLSVFGLAGFALLLTLALTPRRWARFGVRVAAAVAGVSGAALLVIQLTVLGRVCPWCVVADAAGVGAAVVALAGRRDQEPLHGAWRAGWAGAAVLAILVPGFWSLAHRPPDVPEQVRAHWVAGEVTVVEVTDFDCPSCQRVEPVLKEVVERERVRFVRLVAPMPHHENARPAGRAFLAAARQGRGEAMAAALFAAETRAPEQCRILAAGLGLDLAEYDRVVRDPATDAELDRTVEWARRSGRGLPLIWVRDRLFTGVPTAAELAAAIDRARDSSHVVGGR